MDHFTNLNVPCNTNAEKSWDDSAPVSLPGTSDKNAETPTFDLQRAILKERSAENLLNEKYKEGSIIVAIKCKSGIICCSDSRGTVTGDNCSTIEKLSDDIYIMYSGHSAGCVDLKKPLSEKSKLNIRSFTTMEFASLASTVISKMDLTASIIICGVHDDKLHIYEVGKDGAIEVDYAIMAGSGVPVIKREGSVKLTSNMLYHQAKRHALRAVRVACELEPQTKPYLLFLGLKPNQNLGPVLIED